MTTFTYSHSDEELIDQPIGYWATAAGEAVVHHIRTMLAEAGLTQPQWWILNQINTADGRDKAEVVETLRGYLSVGDASLHHNISALHDRALLTEDTDGRLRITDEGRRLRDDTAARQQKTRAEIHEGITDEEYIRTLKVLQRMIHNVGGDAWHH
ncbi:MarR family winged helix-turn-helix transcriptional regulator [Streptomyces sp. NBC_01381]|uniref:MarR family winged helix-turn-helix transcriptional regulator n=1 Tax=Streptomyces sp. NBC_01381 TaxID=2903845 RepID=UPI00225A9518|nr:MarR family winged helix-turn-helix transcriptional regulator [Streptomyces sp. NBC_01381]MCX4669451.1 MarR family winged helix-turn-helix transcriptional regulator [Streptomyces sp. NBC_01381]